MNVVVWCSFDKRAGEISRKSQRHSRHASKSELSLHIISHKEGEKTRNKARNTAPPNHSTSVKNINCVYVGQMRQLGCTSLLKRYTNYEPALKLAARALTGTANDGVEEESARTGEQSKQWMGGRQQDDRTAVMEALP